LLRLSAFSSPVIPRLRSIAPISPEGVEYDSIIKHSAYYYDHLVRPTVMFCARIQPKHQTARCAKASCASSNTPKSLRARCISGCAQCSSYANLDLVTML